MKKHTKLMCLIGILFCMAPTIHASSDENGPYSPGKIIPYAMGIISAFIINTTANICSQTFHNYLKNSQSSTELAKKNTQSLSYKQLSQNNYIVQGSHNLPEIITTTLHNEKPSIHKFAKTHIHFDQTDENIAELSAQKIAFTTHGNYYKIEQNSLQPQIDLKDFQAKITYIAKQATSDQPAVIYINFNKEKLKAPIYPEEVTKVHNLYTGTLAQAINELSSQNPNIRFVTSSPHQTKHTTTLSKHQKTNSYYDPTRLLTNFIVFNAPSNDIEQPKDFLLVPTPQHTKEELSLYIAHTLNQQNQQPSHWFWKKSTPSVVYKPLEQKHIDNYFHEITQEQSQAMITQAIQAAQTKKLREQKPEKRLGFMQQLYSFITPTKVINIDQIDVLAEIADKNIITKKQKKLTFTSTQDLDELFNTIPTTPTVIMTQQERIELKNKIEKQSLENLKQRFAALQHQSNNNNNH